MTFSSHVRCNVHLRESTSLWPLNSPVRDLLKPSLCLDWRLGIKLTRSWLAGRLIRLARHMVSDCPEVFLDCSTCCCKYDCKKAIYCISKLSERPYRHADPASNSGALTSFAVSSSAMTHRSHFTALGESQAMPFFHTPATNCSSLSALKCAAHA